MLSLLIQASCLLVPGAFPESQDCIEALHRRTGIKFMKNSIVFLVILFVVKVFWLLDLPHFRDLYNLRCLFRNRP